MLKILRVISTVNPQAGGPINGLLNSTELLITKGHLVEVLALDDPESSWIETFRYPVHTFKGKLASLQYNRQFSMWLSEHVTDYDVVIIHGLWQYHSYKTAQKCVEFNVPYVSFVHGMLDPWFNRENRLKQLKKSLYWAFFERHNINNASKVLFTSNEEQSLARLSFKPYAANEQVVAYGSQLPEMSEEEVKAYFFKQHPFVKGKRFALFLSRVHPKKGIDLLIEAIAKFTELPSDFVLVIAGPVSDAYKKQLTDLSNKLGVSGKILWVGMLQGDDKWGAFYAADVFILPSHQENFGIVVAEALSTGTPVLISNKVNIWREIKASGAGFVENDSVTGASQLLTKWFALSEAGKEAMQKNALVCYDKHFSIESAVNDLEKVLLSVSNKTCDGESDDS